MKYPRGIYERDGIIYIRFQDERGKIVRESTHQSSIKVGQEILGKRKTEVAGGTFFPARRFEKVLFSVLADKWWKEHGQYTRSCFRFLRKRIDREFGSLKAKEIHVPVIRNFFAELDRHGYSAAYINSHRTMLNSIFNYALESREFDRNPVSSIPQLREHKRTRLLDLKEWRRLLTACNGDPELRCFVVLAALTTMRKSEILRRPWREVHLDGGFPYIQVPITKNNDPKVIPLPASAVEELKNLPSFGNSDYLFPSTRTNARTDPSQFKRPYRWDFRKAFVEVCKKAKIKDLHIHDLRHLGPSILLAQGVPDAVVSKVTGHRSAALRRYQHLSESFRMQTVDLIASVLTGSAGDTRTDTVGFKGTGSASEKKCKGKESKRLSGRPVGTRTPDLYRVKVAL